MRRILLVTIILLSSLYVCRAQDIIYEKRDSIKVMQLLSSAPTLAKTSAYMTYFGNKLAGTPYVAATLEKGDKERLIINLHALDCTTFTENALALSLCMKNGKKSFHDYADYLRKIRYANGEVTYDKRLHYFTSWIDSNSANGYVYEQLQDSLPKNIYTATQRLDIDFMSQHANLYPRLAGDKAMVSKIRCTEKSLTGKTFKYIPKSKLNDHAALKRHIHTGDIIAILTKKQGLDTSHIGIASWHKDGTLHLLNASQIHKKAIDEPMTLYQYMQKHPSQIGIRVIHVK